MKPLHSAIIAGVLAVAATIFCVLGVMSAGFFISGYLAVACAWLMSPVFYVAERTVFQWTNSAILGWLTILLVGSLQFFVPFWIGLRLLNRYGKHAA